MRKVLIGSLVLIVLVSSFAVYLHLYQKSKKECIKITGIKYDYVPNFTEKVLTFESQKAFNTSGYEIETKTTIDNQKREITIETIKIIPPSPDEKVYPTPTLPAAFIDIERTDYKIIIYSCDEKFIYKIINDTLVGLSE